MKANETKKDLNEIADLLRNALSIGKFMDMRERFASPEQWRYEGPRLKKQAFMSWHIAKLSIAERKEEFENYILGNKDQFSIGDVENFQAAIRVMEKEMEEQMEKVLNGEFDEVEELENVEDVEELDEGEQYARETEGTWDGDEYVSDGEEEELEDFELEEE